MCLSRNRHTALPIIHLCSCDMWHCADGVSIFISLSRVSECIELSASFLPSKYLIRWFRSFCCCCCCFCSLVSLSGFVINHWLHIFEPLCYITGSGEFQMIFFFVLFLKKDKPMKRFADESHSHYRFLHKSFDQNQIRLRNIERVSKEIGY